MSKINWRVRVQSKAFWVGAVSAFVLFLSELFSLLGVQLPVSADAVMDVVMMLLSLLAVVGIINDPTTPGVGDSARALGYRVPGGTGPESG